MNISRVLSSRRLVLTGFLVLVAAIIWLTFALHLPSGVFLAFIYAAGFISLTMANLRSQGKPYSLSTLGTAALLVIVSVVTLSLSDRRFVLLGLLMAIAYIVLLERDIRTKDKLQGWHW